jgi:hypothetical protein
MRIAEESFATDELKQDYLLPLTNTAETKTPIQYQRVFRAQNKATGERDANVYTVHSTVHPFLSHISAD